MVEVIDAEVVQPFTVIDICDRFFLYALLSVAIYSIYIFTTLVEFTVTQNQVSYTKHLRGMQQYYY